MRIRFKDALKRSLLALNKPLVSSFEISVEAFKIDRNQGLGDDILYHQNNEFNKDKIHLLIKSLVDDKVIYLDADFKRYYYRISHLSDGEPDEICCLVDPFCYVSHLSAMRKYGLTDRIPSYVMLTTPAIALWNEEKKEVENKYFTEESSYLPIRRSVFPELIRGMKVKRLETKSVSQSILIKNSNSRVSKIGDTFLDMLEKPELCGGMQYVLEVWKSHAGTYINEIIDAIDNSNKKILKVRAGYILDELMGCKNNRVDNWVQFAQRGSSQVLNPESKYSPNFSEKWMLSINV